MYLLPMAKGYTTVAIPDEMIETVERIISKRPDFAYRNRSEFIIEAVRDKVRDISKMQEVIP